MRTKVVTETNVHCPNCGEKMHYVEKNEPILMDDRDPDWGNWKNDFYECPSCKGQFNDHLETLW